MTIFPFLLQFPGYFAVTSGSYRLVLLCELLQGHKGRNT